MRISSGALSICGFILLSTGSLLFSLPAAAADDVWGGVYAYQKKMADYGHPEAQVKLGEMYEEGHGVDQDYDMARQWYEKAAAQGYAEAEERLSKLEARRVREAAQRRQAEQQRLAEQQAERERQERERAEAAARAEQERQEQERLAREAEQARLEQERVAKAAEEEAQRKEQERLARQRAEEAAEALLSTPDAF